MSQTSVTNREIKQCVNSLTFVAGLRLEDDNYDPDDDDVFEPVAETAPKKNAKAPVKRRSQSLSALKDKEENKALRKVGVSSQGGC